MLRITENFENGKTVRLRLDGSVSNDTLTDLNQAISHNRNGAGRIVMLDMAGVEFVTDHAARELVKLRGDNLRIINCSPFIATLLENIAERETRQ